MKTSAAMGEPGRGHPPGPGATRASEAERTPARPARGLPASAQRRERGRERADGAAAAPAPA